MPGLCLIVEPLRLVAKDIATTLHDLTGCDPVFAANEIEALLRLGALPPGTTLSTAFVHMEAEAFACSPLKSLLEERGARVILTAPQHGTTRTPSWPVLPRPFATADLRLALEGASPARRLDPSGGRSGSATAGPTAADAALERLSRLRPGSPGLCGC
jgi:hypothetical protein